MLTQPYYFVDKSLFVLHWLEDSQRIRVFTRPRLTGKSVNLSVLASFLDYQRKHSAGFDRLLLITNSIPECERASVYANKFAVLRLDWEASGVLAASSSLEFEYLLQRYMQGLLLEHMEGLHQPVAELDKKLPPEIDLEGLLGPQSLYGVARVLAAIILLHRRVGGVQSVLLVDDYDEVLRKAGELGNYGFLSGFLNQLFIEAASLAADCLWKVAAFGTHPLLDDGPFREVYLDDYSVAYSRYGDKDAYQEDFGFTEAEVTLALRDLDSPVRLADIQAWYEMEGAGGKGAPLYHPHSVASAVRYGQCQAYWTRDRPLSLHRFPFTRLGPWGVGNLHLLITTEGALYDWRRASPHISYYVGDGPITAAQLVAWLHEEGYTMRDIPGNKETEQHLCRLRNDWFNQQTGFVDAVRAAVVTLDVQPLQQAMDRASRLPCFLNGKPVFDTSDRTSGGRHSCQQVFSRMVAAMLAELVPCRMGVRSGEACHSLFEVDDRRWAILHLGTLALGDPDPKDAQMLQGLRNGHIFDKRHSVTLLVGYWEPPEEATGFFRTTTAPRPVVRRVLVYDPEKEAEREKEREKEAVRRRPQPQLPVPVAEPVVDGKATEVDGFVLL